MTLRPASASSRSRASVASTAAESRRARPREPVDLALLDDRVDVQQVRLLLVGRDVLVDPDDHAVAGLDLLLMAERRVGELALEVPRVDRRHDAAEPSMRAKIAYASCSRRSVGASTYHEPPSGSAVDVTPTWCASTCWVRRARRRRGLGGERHGLIKGVRVQALAAAEHRRERLDRCAHHVDLGLLRGQRSRRPSR